MNIKKPLFLGLALTAFSLAAPLANADECQKGEVVIKFSHVTADTGHPKGDAARAIATRINAEMNGKACMQVFPNSTLYDDDKVMESLLLGDVQIAAPSLAKFEAYTKKFRLFDLPFLFSSMKAVNKFAKSPKGKELLNSLNQHGYVGLGYINNGLKQFSAKKPLIVPGDAKGLKFRVQTSDVAVAMIEALGASAQKLSFKEVYSALQTGVVDGQENTWSNIYKSKFFEVQDGITETNHQLLNYLAITSQEWLDSLEPDVREQFLTIFGEELEKANALSESINEQAKQDMIAAGTVVRQLTPEQRAEWVATMKPVWKTFEDGIGKDIIDAADAANQ